MEESPNMTKEEASKEVAVKILPDFRKQPHDKYFYKVKKYETMK